MYLEKTIFLMTFTMKEKVGVFIPDTDDIDSILLNFKGDKKNLISFIIKKLCMSFLFYS